VLELPVGTLLDPEVDCVDVDDEGFENVSYTLHITSGPSTHGVDPSLLVWDAFLEPPQFWLSIMMAKVIHILTKKVF